MQRPHWRHYLACALLALAAGPAAAEQLSQQELNYAYASIYQAANGLRHSDKLLLVKFESDACEAAVKDMAESMGRIAKAFEALAKADPKLRLDDEGLPVLEKRKRDAVTRDRLLSFKPVVGRTGLNFERTLLLSESAALNQLQFLIAELDAADPDPQRSAVLKETHANVARLYKEIVGLLNREYFRQSKDEATAWRDS